MKNKDSQLIYEAQFGHDGSHADSETPTNTGITCHCDKCTFWSEGNKCVAEEITLTLQHGDCVCETYNPS